MWIKERLEKIRRYIKYKRTEQQINILSAELSKDGNTVEIRYWLTRPEKAQGKFKIYLIEEKNKKRLEASRGRKDGTIKTEYNDFQPVGVLLFDNDEGVIEPDSKTTLEFGVFEVQNLSITLQNK